MTAEQQPTPPKLRWEKMSDGKTLLAHSGDLVVGMVVSRDDGTIGYSITGVNLKYITKAFGDVKHVNTGKLAVERGRRQWLEAAGLVSVA